MTGFWQEAWFFSWELLKFMTLFYVVWVPGFLVAALLTCRFRYQAWNRVALEPKPSIKGLVAATGLGIIASAGRKASLSGMGNLLSRGVSPALGFAFLIASRKMTIYFWAIFALSLGAEFATGQVLGAIAMIALVGPALHTLELRIVGTFIQANARIDLPDELPMFSSWQTVLFSLAGWKAVFRFIGLEIGRFLPSCSALLRYRRISSMRS